MRPITPLYNKSVGIKECAAPYLPVFIYSCGNAPVNGTASNKCVLSV